MNKKLQLDYLVEISLEQVLNQGKSIDEVLAQYPQYARQIRPLLESALWLEQQSHLLDLTSDRLSLQRQNLLNQIRNDSKAINTKKWNLFPIFGLKNVYITAISILLVLLILIGGIGSGVALASQSSLPGDLLYPIKITVENVSLTVSSDPLQRQEKLLKYSHRRLQESETLLLIGRGSDVPKALELYREELRQVVQELPAQSVFSKNMQTMQQLDGIQVQLQQNQQQLQRILQKLSPQQNPIAIDAVYLTKTATTNIEQLLDNVSYPIMTPTATATEFTGEATNNRPTVIQSDINTAVVTQIPPGLWKKTQTNGEPTNPLTQATVKPSKTPRPTATARPANTHKPPAPPSPVKPTKKPKP